MMNDKGGRIKAEITIFSIICNTLSVWIQFISHSLHVFSYNLETCPPEQGFLKPFRAFPMFRHYSRLPEYYYDAGQETGENKQKHATVSYFLRSESLEFHISSLLETNITCITGEERRRRAATKLNRYVWLGSAESTWKDCFCRIMRFWGNISYANELVDLTHHLTHDLTQI